MKKFEKIENKLKIFRQWILSQEEEEEGKSGAAAEIASASHQDLLDRFSLTSAAGHHQEAMQQMQPKSLLQ